MNIYDTYQYSYATPYSVFSNSAVWILMIYLIILVVVGIFALVGYILKGMGMYAMAKRQGMETPVLAFIPFARVWLQGELSGEIKLKEKKIGSPGIWLLVMPFAYGAIYTIGYIVILIVMFGSVLGARSNVHFGGVGVTILLVFILLLVVATILYSALYKVLKVLVDYQIFSRVTSRNMAVVHSVLGVLIPLYESICFFIMRNRSYDSEDSQTESQAENQSEVQTEGQTEVQTEDAQAAGTLLLPVEEVKMPADAEQGTESNDDKEE